jgi:hypothetical protein
VLAEGRMEGPEEGAGSWGTNMLNGARIRLRPDTTAVSPWREASPDG